MCKPSRGKPRPLRCPVCKRGRIMDEVSKSDTIHVILYGPEELEKATWILKCPRCKCKIGASVVLSTLK